MENVANLDVSSVELLTICIVYLSTLSNHVANIMETIAFANQHFLFPNLKKSQINSCSSNVMLFFSRFFPKTFAYKAFFCSYAQNDDVFPLLLYVKEEVARQPLSDTCLIIRLKYQRLKFYKQLVVHHLRFLHRPYKTNMTRF